MKLFRINMVNKKDKIIKDFNNESDTRIIYEILKKLILLMSDNLPSKITSSEEFEEIIWLTGILKNKQNNKTSENPH